MAEKNLADLLNHQLFPHGKNPEHPPFLNSNVKISVALEAGFMKNPKETLRFTVTDGHNETMPAAVALVVMDVLRKIPALQQAATEMPVITKAADTTQEVIEFNLPPGKAEGIIQAIAQLTPPARAASPGLTPEECCFGKVEQVTLLGVGNNVSPEQLAELRQDLAQYRAAPATAVEEALVPQAQQIIEHVQHAAAETDPQKAMPYIQEANRLIDHGIAFAGQSVTPVPVVHNAQVTPPNFNRTPHCT
ncbi:MAG: hypothetical protein JO089_07080 [Alphaproteobacteria bacterium]|nr:hypothetical protein [Alphaproteobacteria bacterium]